MSCSTIMLANALAFGLGTVTGFFVLAIVLVVLYVRGGAARE